MFRRFILLACCIALMAGAQVVTPSFQTRAQDKATVPAKSAVQVKPVAKEKPRVPEGQFTVEQVVELAIYLNGGREGMAQIRRTGIERGRITRAAPEGKTEEASYERRFIRGESVDKDRVRVEQKMPTAEYSLVYAGGEVWGVINETRFTPRQETSQEFLMRQWHGIDTLLRYKENGSTITYIGKEKQKGLDLHVVDVTDKEKRRTRFYISARTARVLWLDYEDPAGTGTGIVKFSRKFHDYRLAQGTLVPYRTVLLKDGTQIEDTQILTITFGQKLNETLFRNPDSAPTTTASKP